MHPWTELETDMPADFLFVFLISAAPAPASSFFVCVCVDGVTKSRTLVSYKVDISDGSGCDCFLSLFANDAKRGRVILIEPRPSFISRVVSAFVCVCVPPHP